MNISVIERIEFYIAPNLLNIECNIEQKLSNINFGNVYLGNYLNTPEKFDQQKSKLKKGYIDALKHQLNQVCKEPTMLMLGDVYSSSECYAFSKTRLSSAADNKYTLLRCLNEQRHWGKNVNIIDEVEFKNKLNKIIWRGTTTGFPPGHHLHRGGDRFSLVTEYYNNTDFIDVGFSFVCQEGESAYESYVKNTLTIDKFRGYKYILSVEGNDKDTGLNWKLKSNSVVFMPKPKISSWLMEDKLIDKFHYIQIKDDFSDLHEKFIWCEKNQEECENIIRNAQLFMSNFDNIKKENEIQNSVIKLHQEKVKYIY